MIGSSGDGTLIGVLVLVNFNFEASRGWIVWTPLSLLATVPQNARIWYDLIEWLVDTLIQTKR